MWDDESILALEMTLNAYPLSEILRWLGLFFWLLPKYSLNRMHPGVPGPSVKEVSYIQN